MEWITHLSRPKDENTRTRWGYTFQWTPEHMTPDKYLPLKQTYDTLGQECLEILDEIDQANRSRKLDAESGGVAELGINTDDGTGSAASPKPASHTPKRDLFALLRDHRTEHPKLQQLWDEVTTVPDWVDWDQIARGQEVFYRYGAATTTGLLFRSLVGGMGANKIVETLSRTGGFNVKSARGRVFETTQHILECTRSLPGVQAPDGEGFISSVRVRLLHASVRQRILKLIEKYPSYYSVEKNGIPINDIDCIGTICSFCPSILHHSLPAQGIFVTAQEEADYTALWRLIAHYTGTPTSFFATPLKSRAIMESLNDEIDPSPTSKILANNVLKSLENTPPAYASWNFLCAQSRWLNGAELCDRLDIPSPPFIYYVLMFGQCLLFMTICYTYRSIPSWDRKKIKTLRRIFWNVIVESKEFGLGGMTDFGFKYVPEMGKTTEKGLLSGGDLERDRFDPKKKKMWEGTEKRNMRVLCVAGIVVGVGSWVTVKIGRWVLDRVF